MKTLLLATALALSITGAHATVNINTAQQSELVRVKGVDKAKARAIIVYRSQNGPFMKVDDLEKVPGFSHETMALIRSDLAVTGDAYVPKPVVVAKKETKDSKDKGKQVALNTPR